MPENELYVLSAGTTADDDESWVRPRPIATALTEVIVGETDLEKDDLDDIDEYVDRDDVATLLEEGAADGSDTVTFTVEDHEVTVDSSGHVDVTDA